MLYIITIMATASTDCMGHGWPPASPVLLLGLMWGLMEAVCANGCQFNDESVLIITHNSARRLCSQCQDDCLKGNFKPSQNFQSLSFRTNDKFGSFQYSRCISSSEPQCLHKYVWVDVLTDHNVHAYEFSGLYSGGCRDLWESHETRYWQH